VKELAHECIRNEKTSNLDKKDAAQQQLEGAIFSLFMDNWASAITLAGAAEGILPNVKGDFIDIVKNSSSSVFGLSESQTVDFFNERRNWLKHHQIDHKEFRNTMDFKQEHAVLMIFRATSKFVLAYRTLSPNMQHFHTWFSENYPDWPTQENMIGKIKK
jgi:hypothetical protein